MKRPLTGLVLVYAAGIWTGSRFPFPPWVLSSCALALLVAFVLLRRSRWSLAVLLALVFSGGALAYRHAATVSSPDDIGRILELRDQNTVVRGIIVSDPGYRSNLATNAASKGLAGINQTDTNRHSFELRLEAVEQYEGWRKASGKLLVFVSELRQQEPPLRYGDVIECSALLRVPPPARNPGTFDWQDWLARRHIPFTATIRDRDSCRVLDRARGNPVTALSLRLQERFEQALRLGLEDEPRLAGVLAGMMIGQRSEVPSDTYEDFQRTGVFHVFAINGLHVGLVTTVVLVFLRTLRIPRRWCGLVAIPLLVLYVFATGAHAGAVRALVMATVWLIGWMLVRPADLLNDLAAAALVLLLWNPEQLFDGGFLLSFQVVTAMVVLTPLIQSRLLPLVSPDPLRPRKLTPRWQLRIERPVKRIVQLLSCSLAAWIGLVPLLAFYFHLFTPISVIANLLVIPLLTGVIALGLTATLAYAVWPWLTATFNNAALVLLAVMTRGVEWLGKVPGGHQFVQTPPLWLIVGYYAIAILLLSRGIPWSWRRWMAAIAVPTACVAAVFMAWPGEVAEITVLDLNDGSSIFVNLPGERNDWLIDGGGNWGGERTVVPFLRAQGVDKLDALVLTCGDGAHAAGLTTVANEIPCARMIESGVPARSKFYGSWQQAVKHQGKTMRYLRAGDEMTVANKLKVRALNPSSVVSGNRTDDNSLVLMLEFGSTRLLLMSDAGETVENRLLRSGEALHAKIILKGRHGREPSCTDAFLDAVRPEIVVQSVSARPSDRYLEPDLRERLQQRNVKLYRTDETGAVTIRLTSKGYTVETWVK